MCLGEPSTDLVGYRNPLREIVYNIACKHLFELFFFGNRSGFKEHSKMTNAKSPAISFYYKSFTMG